MRGRGVTRTPCLLLALLPALAACSPGQPSLDGNLSGNAAQMLENQANMLEGEADNMVAAAAEATANRVETMDNATEAATNLTDGNAEAE